MTKTVAPISIDTVIASVLDLMQLERAGSEMSTAKKDRAAKLGTYFETLAVEYADDVKAPPRNKRETFSLPKYDEAVGKIEEQIKAQAVSRMGEFGITIEGSSIVGFKLPQSWRQYKSNVKQWIALGLAKQYGRVGIGKITSGLGDASKLADAARNAETANLHNLRMMDAYLQQTLTKMEENENVDKFKAYKHDMHRAIVDFLLRTREVAHKHGRAGVEYVKPGTTVEFNAEAVPTLVPVVATPVAGLTPDPKPEITVPEVEAPTQAQVDASMAQLAKVVAANDKRARARAKRGSKAA